MERFKNVVISWLQKRPNVLARLERGVWRARFEAWKAEHPCPVFEWRMPLYEYVSESEKLDGGMDYLEFGVFEGATLKWWVKRNQHPDSRFYGFDTFVGLPQAWDWAPAGHFSTQGKTPLIDDKRCLFEVGLFQNTLPAFLDRVRLDRRKVIHLDADLYGSTIFVLLHLAPRLQKDDILIFDEFMTSTHEFRAWCDFLETCPLEYQVLAKVPDAAQVAIRILGPAVGG
ncbi:MAG TPA: TylF/MycF/NovP-related O-methyltransferase [Kiritimatiellia bacterium]|nr:TylF/MycF/NovP-related O-methyltransferase [Kiritimatiellia bacterium]